MIKYLLTNFIIFSAVDYGRSAEIKRPSANYENAEQISNETESDPSESNDVRASRNNKHKKMLKGVENAAFNPNEPNQKPQSESELYFGDVSSCCGPESSLYDVATDKEGKNATRFTKTSKRKLIIEIRLEAYERKNKRK